MQYTSWGGKVTNVIQIPVCSNKTSFIQMNQSKQFLDKKLPQYIGGDNDTIDDGKAAAD